MACLAEKKKEGGSDLSHLPISTNVKCFTSLAADSSWLAPGGSQYLENRPQVSYSEFNWKLSIDYSDLHFIVH